RCGAELTNLPGTALPPPPELSERLSLFVGSEPVPQVPAPARAPHFHGHRQRLRQRFLDAGSEAVSDYELLELILFRAIPQRDVKPLAKQLLDIFGSFAEVIAAPATRLAEMKGLSEAAITE